MNRRRPDSISYLAAAALAILLFGGCITQSYVSIEQMVPPALLVPDGARRLGLLNNCSRNNVRLLKNYIDLFDADADSVVEYIAMGFADSGIFDEVVVLDSCIFPQGQTRGNILSQAEVKHFCDTMQVDMLYVCDYAGMSSCNKDTLTAYGIDFNRVPRHYHLIAHAYAPARTKPVHTYIFQQPLPDGVFRTEKEVTRMEHETYPHWGSVASHAITPQWVRRERSFYTGTSRELREAKICVRDGNWDGARRWWQQLARKGDPPQPSLKGGSPSPFRGSRRGSGRESVAAAYNEALWYEMHDSIDRAMSKLQEARTFVTDTTALDSTRFRQWNLDAAHYGLGEYPYTDYQRIRNYERILRDRQAEVQKLNRIHQW